MLFQIADDLIDHSGNTSIVGKNQKDQKQGKATLISLLGRENAVKYTRKLILKLNNKIRTYGPKSDDLLNTIDYILNRNN